MDVNEAHKTFLERVMKLEPPNLSRLILGYLIQEHGAEKLLSLGCCTDEYLKILVDDTKRKLDGILPCWTPPSHEPPAMGYPIPESMHLVDPVLQPMSLWLHSLEKEIADLIDVFGNAPIPIAKLPKLYFDVYGKTLLADGYLDGTESQTNSEIENGLKRLLAHMSNSIYIIDRPHEPTSVILLEDLPEFCQTGGHSPVQLRTIYLTCPPESHYTLQQVNEYFSTFGEVEEVGSVSHRGITFCLAVFSSPEIVKTVSSKGNPHFIGGCRVDIKPYYEISKLPYWKYVMPQHRDMDLLQLLLGSTETEVSGPLEKQKLTEEYEEGQVPKSVLLDSDGERSLVC